LFTTPTKQEYGMPLTSKKNTAILFAILAAAFYALSAPASKYILAPTPPTMMAAFLYLGAGSGMLLITLGRRITHTPNPADRPTRAHPRAARLPGATRSESADAAGAGRVVWADS